MCIRDRQQMVRILVHGETVEGDEGKRMALQGAVEQAQMYAVCMQELSLLVSSHSPTLADLCGTLWHGFVGLFRKSLAGEEAQLAREVEAHQRCSRQLRYAQEDAGHFEAEAAALRLKVAKYFLGKFFWLQNKPGPFDRGPLTLLQYLRVALHNGGFPGLHGNAAFEPLRRELVEGLEPF